MGKNSQHVYFSVTGEFVTRHARDLVQEGNWVGAIRFLKTSIIGFTYDHAISVLSGEKCLTGTNNINLDNDPSPDNQYLKQLDFLYGSHVKLDGRWYKPYAYVTNYGRRDFREFDKDTSFVEGQEVWGSCRARHYCDNRTDKVFVLKCGAGDDRGYHCALFTIAEEPPIWMQFTKTPQEAVDSCRQLTEDGHVQRYGHETEHNKTLSSRLERRFEVMAEVEEKKKVMKIPPAIPDTKFKSHLGWVSPTGEFYGCPFTGHIDLSYEIIRGNLGIDDFDNSERELEKRGWLKIGGGGALCYFEKDDKVKITQAQIDLLHDWCMVHKQPFPNHLLEETE